MPARKPVIAHAAKQDYPSFNRALVESDTLGLLRNMQSFLTGRGVKGYVVGGYVRDALLGRETADVDIAIEGDALSTGKEMAAAFGGTFVPLDLRNKVARVVLKDAVIRDIDLSSFRGKIETDLSRRDFTIDAMALDLDEIASGSPIVLIDPFRGRDDLDRGIIRSVSATALADDPVRVLRGVRLAAELGFAIDHDTATQTKESAGLLKGVAGERLREELLRLFDSSRGGHFLFTLDELGLLTALIPELKAARGVTQPAEHHWDVFTHSIVTVTAIDFILRQGLWDYPSSARILREVPWPPVCTEYFASSVGSGSTRRTLLKLAALLHDISKPQMKAPDTKGRIRFIGHHTEGAEVAGRIMERLRFSTREIKFVTTLTAFHLRPTQMGHPPTRHAIYRYFRDAGDAAIDTLYLSLADHLATRGPSLIPEYWKEHAETVRVVLEEHFRKKSEPPPAKLLDGNDLINIFGMKPGPALGKLLEKVREAQATGELTTRQQALDYARADIEAGKNKLSAARARKTRPAASRRSK